MKTKRKGLAFLLACVMLTTVLVPSGPVFAAEESRSSEEPQTTSNVPSESLEETQTTELEEVSAPVDETASTNAVNQADTSQMNTPNESSAVKDIVSVEEADTISIDSVTLDMADGKIYIDETGYQRSLNGTTTAKVPFTGSYIITGTYQYNIYRADIITVVGGTEEAPINITLKDTTIDATNETNSVSDPSVLMIGSTDISNPAKEGHVHLTLEGTNTLRASALGAGIELVSSTGRGIKSTLVIDGDGSLETIGGEGGAGIGAADQSVSQSNYKITINSGTITAVGGTLGAGIGGGKNTTGGEIIINGGTITAVGGSGAAGIGTGFQQVGPYYDLLADMSVTINGGVIDASSVGLGAGIGIGRMDITYSIEGLSPRYMTVNIGGSANVTATGGSRSAGIGQGYVLNTIDTSQVSPWIVDSINISGGTVNAKGQDMAAGIGTSQKPGIVKAINISGGTVTAEGNYGSAGIGTGYKGIFEAINISNATVHAVGGDYAAGIGTGYMGTGGDIQLLSGVIDAKSTLTDPDDIGQGSGIGSGTASSIKSLKIGANAHVTATGSMYASGIGRSYFSEDTPDAAFPIVIENGAQVTAYAIGDLYSEETKADPADPLPDALYLSAIDQGCITHANSSIGANMLMGDFKDIPNADADQNVVIRAYQTKAQEKDILLPAGYASFATTVQTGLHRVNINDTVYAGDTTKRSETNLMVNMGDNREELHAYWMLQPVVIEEYTVSFAFASAKNPDGIAVPESQTVEDGQTITAPTLTTPENWMFDGWYTDEECTQKYDFTTPVQANKTLFGKWTYTKTEDPSKPETPSKPAAPSSPDDITITGTGTTTTPQTGDHASPILLLVLLGASSCTLLVLAGKRKNAQKK